MKTQKFHLQSVVAVLTTVFCVGGALLVPMTASVAANASAKTKPSKTTPSKTTTTPVAGASDIILLQAALSITLTDAQKTSITASATTRDAAIKAAVTAYQTQVAAIFGLSAADLDAKIKSMGSTQTGGDLTTLLGTVLGISLTDAQKTALTDAATTRDAAISAAYDAYGISVAAIVNLSATDLQIKVQAYLDAQSAKSKGGSSGGKGGGDKSGSSGGKGGGGDCKPPTTGTTTTTGSTTGTTTTTTGTTTTSGGYA